MRERKKREYIEIVKREKREYIEIVKRERVRESKAVQKVVTK